MYSLKYSKHFKMDLRKFKHKPNILKNLEDVLDLLILEKTLPKKLLNHDLCGEFKGCSEYHIQPNILLIYKKDKKELLILLLRFGGRSDLF
jgi:mRNA interferase YafQ